MEAFPAFTSENANKRARARQQLPKSPATATLRGIPPVNRMKQLTADELGPLRGNVKYTELLCQTGPWSLAAVITSAQTC